MEQWELLSERKEGREKGRREKGTREPLREKGRRESILTDFHVLL